jgi:hypothetical protein
MLQIFRMQDRINLMHAHARRLKGPALGLIMVTAMTLCYGSTRHEKLAGQERGRLLRTQWH